jgi:hypothetical protein
VFFSSLENWLAKSIYKITAIEVLTGGLLSAIKGFLLSEKEYLLSEKD